MSDLKFKATALSLVSAVLGLTLLATSANAKKVNPKTYQSVSTGFCLDSNGNGQAYAIGCNGGNYQNWQHVNRKLVNVSTGFCLDSNQEGNVYTMACNGGKYQNWQHVGQTLVNVATGLCLDGNGDGKMYTLACNGGNYQNWK